MKGFSINLNLDRNKTIDIKLQNNDIISKTSHYPFIKYIFNRGTFVRIKTDNNSEIKLEELKNYLDSKNIDYEICFK